MTPLRQLVSEIHHRSLWQVLSVYLVGSWGALQVVESVTENAGLPDWVPPFAMILLILGLPVVMATAIVQEGGRGAERRGALGIGDEHSGDPASGVRKSDAGEGIPAAQAASAPAADDLQEWPEAGGQSNGLTGSGARSAQSEPGVRSAQSEPGTQPRTRDRIFTWRNALAGGVAAFALLGMAVAGYFVMWSTGIGPVGSLAAQGVFDEGDAVVLARFDNTSADGSLGDMVTEALRVDLAGSAVMTLVEPGRIQDALRRMGRTADEPLSPALAQEVAVRDGFKAVIQGSVGSAGSGYIFVASMVSADEGNILASFRETARGPDDVIDAIDKLSQSIREKAGESLRAIKAEEPLAEVTTSSLEALRKYAEADRLADEAKYPRAISALREAVGLDPSFAMAYRKLAVLLMNSGGSLADQIDAATRAYELRDRLTERERYLADAYYQNLVTRDVDAEIQAYQTVLERYPDDQAALNNIAIALANRTRIDEAVAALERAVSGPGASASAYTNLPTFLAVARGPDEARAALETLEQRYPGRKLWVISDQYNLAAYAGDGMGAHKAGEELLALPEAQGWWKAAGTMAQIVGDVMRGRLEEAEEHRKQGRRELADLGLWEAVLGQDIEALRIDVILGRVSDAERTRARTDLEADLEALPTLARDYAGVTAALARLGDRVGVEQTLRRWKEDGIPSSTSPAFDEARRLAEGILSGKSDRAAGLEALTDLSRDLNCPDCWVWDRAEFAQDAGRLQEAAELYARVLRAGSSESDLDPIRRIMTHERLGAVHESLGDSTEAAKHYAAFARYWTEADPDLQPRVKAARERATALEGS